ncbi:TPA: replication initiator protein A [Staphylococcus aureus]|nr:replication initiator protein A [Staphylococcus aureus]HDF3670891.1 replication initiator protein A [Staphylococcus aureus]
MQNKEYEGNFYKLYLFLFYDEDFSNLSVNAKLMYTLLSDKNDLSKQTAEQGNTQFFDEKNRLYSIYSNKDLATDLKINIKSVPRIKKQLKEKGLLVEERQGLGLPNRIYPKQPYTDGFIYKYDTSKWFLLPKNIFAYKYYNELDNQAKIFYSILYNTFRYSEKKGQYMNNGKVFCTLTYSKIQSITGFSLEKIRKMKEDLRKKHLITYESGGFSKADRFYVHLPQISKNMEITDSNTWNHLKKKPIEIKYRNEKIIFDINHNPKIKGYKLRYDAEVTQTKSNKTYIIKTYFNNLYINKTTTKPQKQKHCGNCGNDKNNIIFKIKDEYQIHKLTKTYERKIQDFSNIFSLDIIHYAIEYAGEKAVTSPTNLLLTILSNWKQAGVQTLEQAKGQENNYRKGHDTGNTSSEVKSIEKTPQWLLDKQNEKNNDKDQDEMSEEEKIAFEKEREALLKEIESFWT